MSGKHPTDPHGRPLNDPELSHSVDAWSEEELEDEPVLQTDESTAMLGSMLVHVVIIVSLAIVPLRTFQPEPEAVVIVSPPTQEETPELIDEIDYSEAPSVEIGANSESQSDMAEASAEMFAESPEIPSPVELELSDLGDIEVNRLFNQPVAPMDRLTNQKGAVGQGETGASGAVDRLTYEILQSMEERPTLVVWLFDQSGSLHRQRREIRDRFDRIYEELGIIKQGQSESDPRAADDRLLTSVIAFGERVNLLTPRPTADIQEIRAAIDSINLDESGIERVFSAIFKGVEQSRRVRAAPESSGRKRNVLFVVVTDERGDDATGLEATIKECRKYGIPVYVIGVPAPFGRENTFVKYVDPDPNYDQSPQWAQVDQGPESIMSERIKLGYRNQAYREPVVDSGFGPYSLSRLAYETGGIYFTVHPNRRVGRPVRSGEIEAFSSRLEYFFDPAVMEKYQPDYVSENEYLKRVNSNRLRQTLVQAARLPRVEVLLTPQQRFVKTSEAALVNALSAAQREAARMYPPLAELADVLLSAEQSRDAEIAPRWLAGFDLALGTVLAHKVRAEAYNAMLARAKRGMKFEEEKNNTWILQPSSELDVGSKIEKEGQLAVDLLQRVVSEHPGTPWSLLAKRELNRPGGWTWREEFTDLNPPQDNNRPAVNNNTPRPARDENARMLPKPPPRRPIPKL